MGFKNYLSFFYFGSAVLGAIVGTYVKFPLLFIFLPIFVLVLTKKPRLSLFIALFIISNLSIVSEVKMKNVQFVGTIKNVQADSSIASLRFYDGIRWRRLWFDVKLYKKEKVGTIVYFIGELIKTNSYPKYYAKTTFYATATNYTPTSLIYESFESFRSFIAKVDPFYQNLFGNQTRDENFVKSGLYHIFCVSGMHVSLLYLFSYYLASLITYQKIIKIILSLIFPTIFVIGSGMNLPSQRALWMLMLSSIFNIFDYKVRPINTVSLVGLFLVLVNPEIVLSLSFYMTFFSTIGVLSATNNFFANIGGFLGSAPYVSLISSTNVFSIIATILVSVPVQIIMFCLSIAYVLYVMKLHILSMFLLYSILPFAQFVKVIANTFSKFPLIPQHIIVSIAFSITFIIYLAIMQEYQSKKLMHNS